MNENRVKSPVFGKWIPSWLSRREDSISLAGDFEESFLCLVQTRGKIRAYLWYWFQVLISIPQFIIYTTQRSLDMFGNYVKIALRTIRRYKGYSFINIFGLAVGIACCILILLFVQHELSYDKYHNDLDRLFRVSADVTTNSGSTKYAAIAPPVGPSLIKDFPQIEYAARILYFESTRLVKHNEVMFYETNFVYADQDIFNILTIPFLYGDPDNSLDRPFTVVIPQHLSEKYFGSENPVGKTLSIDQRDYQVSGVIKDLPDNTHFIFDTFVSMHDLRDPPWMQDWTWPGMYTYIKLKPNTDAGLLNQQIAHFADGYVKNYPKAAGQSFEFFLQRIQDIYLKSDLEYDIGFGELLYLYIFSAVGIFILLIACINFINLTTARSSHRFREVGMRKVAGAERSQLIRQFTGETFLFAVFAFLLALLLVVLTKGLFNELAGIDLQIKMLLQPYIIFWIFILLAAVGIIAGIYPAFVLSSFKPVSVLKGTLSRSTGGGILRKVLVVTQFTISIVLIVGTIITYQQTGFMKNKNLGFNKEQKIIIPVRGRAPLAANFESVKSEFLNHNSILNASVSGNVQGQLAGTLRTRLIGEADLKSHMMYYNFVDSDFFRLFDMKMAAGRPFSSAQHGEMQNACIINEAALQAFGWNTPEEALGNKLETGLRNAHKEIIGVVSDFHYRRLKYGIEPLVIEYDPDMFDYINLMVDGRDFGETMKFIESTWQQLFPDKPFEYFFLDSYFEQLYQAEEKTNKLFNVLTVLGLFIACLGLFGLASFTAEQRTKEIGIRKVLGASVQGVMIMLSKEYIKWVIAANIIALPASYFLMEKWLRSFAYRIPLRSEVFILAAVSSLVIALVTVSYQAVKAALANPVEALHFE